MHRRLNDTRISLGLSRKRQKHLITVMQDEEKLNFSVIK